MDLRDLPEPPEGSEWVYVPDTVDFGEQGVDDLDDDEFVNALIEHMTKPIEDTGHASSLMVTIVRGGPLTAGGPAIRPEDEFSSEI